MELEVQVAAIVGGVFLVALSVAYWRQATLAAVVLLVFEGALRKWVLPEAQAYLYWVKDFLLLGAYIGFFATRGAALPVPQAQPLIVLLAMAVAYGTLQMFNPALPSLTLAAVGWRSYFFYAPLLFLVPHLFRSSEQIYRGLRRYALLAIPIAALGVLQFYSPMDSVINTNVQHEAGVGGVVGFGNVDRVRVGGTFSFVSGYAAYLLVVALLIAALVAARGWRLRGNVALYGALVLTLAAMFATGSRAPVYLVILAAVFYAVVASAVGDLSLSSALRAGLGATIVAVTLWYFLSEPAGAFYGRAADTGDTVSRLVSPFVEPFVILEEAGAAGFGIGAAHQSAAFLIGSGYSWWTNGIVTEAETSRVMLELGLLGFLLVFLFRALIALFALRAALTLKSRPGRALALFLAFYLGVQIFGAVIFNPTANLLYWFAAGLLFAICRFEARGGHAVAVRRPEALLRLHRSA
jgi:hypothetical protein